MTLSFARALADRLNKEPGIKAFLTRDDDEFLSLSQRVLIARALAGEPDLLIRLVTGHRAPPRPRRADFSATCSPM